MNVNALLGHIQLDPINRPRRVQSQQMLVQLDALHRTLPQIIV
jgi:hypothetical protein